MVFSGVSSRYIDINQSAVRSRLDMNANRNAAHYGIIASSSVSLDPRVDFDSNRSCSYNFCSYSRPFPVPRCIPSLSSSSGRGCNITIHKQKKKKMNSPAKTNDSSKNCKIDKKQSNSSTSVREEKKKKRGREGKKKEQRQ